MCTASFKKQNKQKIKKKKKKKKNLLSVCIDKNICKEKQKESRQP